MLTYPLHIAFSSYTIIGLTLLILAASVAFYLLRLPSKSQATKSLIAFFVMVALSGGAMILANAFFYWDRLFVPWQDFWILAAGVALTQFAYRFPRDERSIEGRVVLIIMGGVAFFALAYCLIFDFRFLFNWVPGLNVSDVFYLLLPIGTLLIVIIFLRRSVHFSRQVETALSPSASKNIGWHLIHPKGEDARVFRSLGLALSLAFLPGLQTLSGFPDPFGFILSNIGSILAIIAIALVYFNLAPEVTSFMAKLVGITLATVLLILTIASAFDVYLAREEYFADRLPITTSLHDALIRTGDLFVNPLQVAYVISWDTAKPKEAASYQQLYLAKDDDIFDIDILINENREGYLEAWSQPIAGQLSQLTNDEWRQMLRYWTYPLGSGQEDYQSYIFVDGNTAYEIGFPSAAIDDDLSAMVSKWLIVILSSTAFVLLIFPRFFRRTLMEPLGNLLDGVRRVNQRELEMEIPVRFNDEIGFLTQSFNQMVGSLKELTFKLENRAMYLEELVSERTLDLIKINLQLEKENTEREKAEIQLNLQLLYQRALAACSQTLLRVAEDESSQHEVLNQALEHLRAGAKASRAHVFRIFKDEQLGPCMGMIAEVCAPGIPAHINNPANRKYRLSQLPTEFTDVLAKGNPYGGLVREVFASTPALQETLLSQTPPLVSLMLFPLFIREQAWGFIGFDDCSTERVWDETEISMLRTASEMIGNTLQRWEIESELRETLNELENRVYRRTEALTQSVTKLNEEIQQRHLAQNDLEARLRVEAILAAISTRLLEPTKIRANIEASLEDLSQIMDAERIFLVEFDLHAANQVREYIEWRGVEMPPISEDIVQGFMDSLFKLRDRLRDGETIYIEDISNWAPDMELDMSPLQVRNIQSLVLAPITIDQRVHGVLGCSNLKASTNQVQMNLQALELVTGMIESLWQRENLIQTLEEQIAERTRQLTTFLDMAMLSDQAQDLADILQPTLLSITQIAGCDAAGIHIINEMNSSLELVAQRGIPLEFLQPLNKVTIDLEFATWLDETDPYEFLGDLDRGPAFPEPFCFPGLRAFFANRLGTGSKSLGLLSCYRFADQPFSPFQATLLTALGELLSIIVENYRYRAEAEELAAVEERQRLAREIHDAVSQSVYSLSLFARSAINAQDDEDQVKLFSNLQDIEATALQAMREMRLLLYQLREAGQDENIATALDTRYKQVENRLGIQASSDIDTEIFLPTQIQHQVWRIIVEALNNMVKHGSATHVQVQITCLDEYLIVSIQDNGIGFDIRERFPGMGLKNMRTRAETLGGQLEISSELGQGTQITLKLPMACIHSEEGD